MLPISIWTAMLLSMTFPSLCLEKVIPRWKNGGEMYLSLRWSGHRSHDEAWLLCDLNILRLAAHHYTSQLSSVTHCTAAGHKHPQDEYLSKPYKGTGNNAFVTGDERRPKLSWLLFQNNALMQTNSLPGNCNYMKLFVRSLVEHTFTIRCSWLF